MASRLKEDARNERTIRNLHKLPDNRRCINCNSLGPQYVCTTFWTFVCTTCSGIHREFTHRVKSISMAKFTSQEVTALQGGGNAIAKQIYLKEWDPQINSLPDSSNIEKVRDFIRHVYVDKRYTGGKISGGSQSSPPYENKLEDRFGNGTRVEDKSPDHQKDGEILSSPINGRPVRDILRENVTTLRVIEPPRSNSSRSFDGFVRTQRSASSSSLSSPRNPGEIKKVFSLIDFDDVSEPKPEPATIELPPQVKQPTPPITDNWANFGSVEEVKVVQPPSSANSFESLMELSGPASVPFHSIETHVSGGAPLSNNWGFSSGNSVAAFTVSPFSSYPANPPPISHPIETPSSGRNSYVQFQQSSPFPAPAPQPFAPNNQPWDAFANASTTKPAFEASGGRLQLPEDIFAAPAPVNSWQTGPSHGFGFNMQYGMQMPTPTMLPRSKSTNPFDVDDDEPLPFPSMGGSGSLQGVLPTGLRRTSSLGAPTTPTWTQSPIPPSSYYVQQAPSNMPLRPQGATGFEIFNQNEGLGGLYSAATTQNNVSYVGGNPFG